MTGRDFVACAEHFARGSTEAELRSAVSRAYYGAFHEALALLHACGVWLPKTEQVHVKVGYCLRDCGDQDAAKAARELELLRSPRKEESFRRKPPENKGFTIQSEKKLAQLPNGTSTAESRSASGTYWLQGCQ